MIYHHYSHYILRACSELVDGHLEEADKLRIELSDKLREYKHPLAEKVIHELESSNWKSSEAISSFKKKYLELNSKTN